MLRRMRAVLFDLDGTLIDSGALYLECYRRAFASALDTPPSWGEMMRRRPASERLFLLEWLGEELGDRVHGLVCETYEAMVGELLGGFFEGVPEMLEDLKARGVPMGIVTGKSRRAFEATCRTVDLSPSSTWWCSRTTSRRPSPTRPGWCGRSPSWALEAHEAVYVGDTPMDVEAAHRAGMVGASALWCRPPEDRQRIREKLDPRVWALSEPRELTARLPR